MNKTFFVNDRYVILSLLLQYQVKIGKNEYVKLSQQEISDIAQFSKVKVNTIMKDLLKNGYVTSECRGRYTVTDKGKQAVNLLNQVAEL